jgi:hypothetical protein
LPVGIVLCFLKRNELVLLWQFSARWFWTSSKSCSQDGGYPSYPVLQLGSCTVSKWRVDIHLKDFALETTKMVEICMVNICMFRSEASPTKTPLSNMARLFRKVRPPWWDESVIARVTEFNDCSMSLQRWVKCWKWQRNTMKYEETGSWYVIVSFRDLFRWKWVILSCGFCGCRFDLFRPREHKLLWLTMRITRGVKICKSRRAFDWATWQHDPYTSSTYIDMPYMPTISGLARRKASWGIFGCSWLWLQFGAQSDLNAGWTQDGIWLWLFLIFGIEKVTRWLTTHDHLCWSHSKNPTKKSRVMLSFQQKNRSAPFLDLKLIDQTYPLTYIHHHQGMGSMVQIPGALVCMSTQFFVPQFISISTSVIWSHWWQHFDGYIASWSILPMLKSQVVTKSPLQIVKINHYLYHHMSW